MGSDFLKQLLQVPKLIYHITYGPGVPEHNAGNRINALVQYRFLLPRFAIITLSRTGHKHHVFAEMYRAEAVIKQVLKAFKCVM